MYLTKEWNGIKKFCTSVIQRKESMNNLIVEYTKKIAKWLVTTCKDV